MSRVSQERKSEILRRIEKGERVSQVAEQYGLKEATVRSWIQRSGEHGNVLELSRLRRENEALMSLVGRLTYEKSVREKNASGSRRS